MVFSVIMSVLVMATLFYVAIKFSIAMGKAIEQKLIVVEDMFVGVILIASGLSASASAILSLLSLLPTKQESLPCSMPACIDAMLATLAPPVEYFTAFLIFTSAFVAVCLGCKRKLKNVLRAVHSVHIDNKLHH